MKTKEEIYEALDELRRKEEELEIVTGLLEKASSETNENDLSVCLYGQADTLQLSIEQALFGKDSKGSSITINVRFNEFIAIGQIVKDQLEIEIDKLNKKLKTVLNIY
jgi:hypothetical protein